MSTELGSNPQIVEKFAKLIHFKFEKIKHFKTVANRRGWLPSILKFYLILFIIFLIHI